MIMSRFKHVIDTPVTQQADVYHPTNYNNNNVNQQVLAQAQLNWPTKFPKSIIGLEYDGVINVDIGKPITHPDEWKPIPGSLEAIRMMRLKGHKVVILSDQGGIYKGIQTTENVDAFHIAAMQIFGAAGIFSIDGFLYAESDIKEDKFAKPNIGMFERAEQELYQGRHRFKNNGFYVGHRMKDLKAGFRAGATPVLVRTGCGEQTEKDLQKFSAEKLRKKTRKYDDLLQFAQSL